MKASEEELLSYLLATASDHGDRRGLYADTEGIIRWTGLSRSTVYRAIAGLARSGYIVVDGNFRPASQADHTSSSHRMFWLTTRAMVWSIFQLQLNREDFILETRKYRMEV